MSKTTFYTVAKDGKPGLQTSKDIKALLVELDGKPITITIEKRKKDRSNAQNRYWWGVVVERVRERFKELGHNLFKEEVHEFLKTKSLATADVVVNKDTGETIPYVKSTTKLSTSEFMELIADIQIWAAQILDINIPDPQEEFESIT